MSTQVYNLDDVYGLYCRCY